MLLWSAATLFALGLSSSVHAVPVHTDRTGLRRAWSRASEDSLSTTTPRLPRGGFEIPITRKKPTRSTTSTTEMARKRGSVDGSVGLGDNSDLLYSVPIEYGHAGVSIALNIDTGSSDHWVLTDLCETSQCKQTTSARYPSSALNVTGTDVLMQYGDSTTGTSASGPVAYETVGIAGVEMTDAPYAAINKTDNSAIYYGASGIFGLGFPSGSVIQSSLVNAQFGEQTQTDDFISSTPSNGPLLSRIAMTGQLEQPMFTITLQRDELDVSGSGVLTVGSLPNGVDNSSLTWVPVRLYSTTEGGLPPPTFAPNEIYPFRWEVEIDGVMLDGQTLPASALTGVSPGTVSALIDTGNSLIRGPSDTVNTLLSSVSSAYARNSNVNPTLPCTAAHNLSFIIGGQAFPVDPLDFISDTSNGGAETCVADSVVSTDPPSTGALFSWSLGDPFMKSNLIAFYYGNLTNPSVDPPRIGFMSLVSQNADATLTQAVDQALSNGGVFESTVDIAPTQSAEADPEVTVSTGGAASSSVPTISPISAAATPVAAAATSDSAGDASTVIVTSTSTASPKASGSSNSALSSRAVAGGGWTALFGTLALGMVMTAINVR